MKISDYQPKADAITTMLFGGMATQLECGAWLITHFNSNSMVPKEWDDWNDWYVDDNVIDQYGVADTAEQVMAHFEPIDAEMVIFVTPVVKAHEPSSGGWRWHKWGTYIGTKKPTAEYLHDEPEIEQVYCFHGYKTEKASHAE